MNIFTKKSPFGAIAVAGSGLIIAGAAAPAMASTSSEQIGSLTSSSDSTAQAGLLENLSVGDLTSNFGLTGGELSNSSPLVFAPEVSIGPVETGDVSTGDVLSGDNLSGNAVASGNEVAAPVASGNETSAINNSGDVVTDVVDGTVETDAIVDEIMSDIDPTSILGD
ncbi:hypothetical protein [Marisediminicola antarctica]|uniref:Secreted protein n=1 Tax=Marisediminicola antarctica TaxID=674079 RepID=A0A7L5ADU9_9MICO|nr:hypothetical protein [Marisediminicola antarctica]QHO68428.1 hypothetical protein BHD05_01020 [Marisediminicola antarctica]